MKIEFWTLNLVFQVTNIVAVVMALSGVIDTRTQLEVSVGFLLLMVGALLHKTEKIV